MVMRVPIRVLYVLGTAGVGGVETFVRGIAGTINRERFEISVCVVGCEGELSSELRQKGVPVMCLGSDHFGLQAMCRFHVWVQNCRPHVLHANVGGRRIRWLARGAGCRKIICHCHGPSDDLAESVRCSDPRVRSTLNNAYGVSSDLVLACSGWLGSRLSSIVPNLSRRIRVLHYGVNAEAIPCGETARMRIRKQLGVPSHVLVLGFVGRFVPQKGIGELRRVAAAWLEREPQGRFLAIGDGPLRSMLDDLRGSYTDRVYLAGARSDATTLLAAMDVMVLTSKWEAFGIVNLEAMAAGIPLVAFDIDGVHEAIGHGRTGVLVAPGDVDAMGASVDALMRSPLERTAVGEAGRSTVQQEFSLRKMVDVLGAIYERL
jgi:glycosyltransferase involved in cell wall biosynthesis